MTKKYPKIVDQSGYLAKILVVDEIGLYPEDLVSDLLAQGYLVYLSTGNAPTDKHLLENRNLYIIIPKEEQSLSLIDYLVIIQKPDTIGEEILSRLPKSYKTFIFRQWYNKLVKLDQFDKLDKLVQSTQLVYYEEIIDRNTINKLDQLVQLRREGTRLNLNQSSYYYPVNPRTIGQAVLYLIDHPSSKDNYWLSTEQFAWQILIEQINSLSFPKIKRRVGLDMPALFIPESLTSLRLSSDMDIIIRNRISQPAGQLLPARMISPALPIKSNKPNPNGASRLKQLFVSPYRLFTKMYIKITPVSGYKQPPVIRSLWRLLIVVLVLVNLGIISRGISENLVKKQLNNYHRLFTKVVISNTSLIDFQKQTHRLTFWQKAPLSWLVSRTTREKLPPRFFIDAANSWLIENNSINFSEATLLTNWLTGQTISANEWVNLKNGYQKHIASTINLSQLVKNDTTNGLSTIAFDSGLSLNGWLDNYQQKITKLMSAVKLWEKLLTDKPIRLLVLLQNNYELRPTGGLVSAYGLLTLQNDQPQVLQFYDSSVLDTKITGRIQPPVVLTNQLGENRWFFRDINWEPDLALTADRAIWYYETAEKMMIDGLLVTDARFWLNLNMILANEPPNDNKFFSDLVTASVSQKGTLSSGPFLADFANQAVNQLLNQISDKPANASTINFPPSTFVDLFYRSFEEKDIALYLKNTQTQTVLAKLGWDGKVKRFVKPESKSEILADYLMVNEANTGVNLVNRYVSRSIEQVVSFNSNQKLTTVKLTYSNSSPVSGWPGGNYQAYVRLLLPGSVSLRSIMVDRGNGLVALSAEKINGSQFDDKAVFGFRIDVQPGETVTYQIDYTDQGFIGDTKVGTYLLLVQKQPGITNQRYQLSITGEKLLTPLRSIPDGQIANNGISVISDIKKDTIFQVDFGQ